MRSDPINSRALHGHRLYLTCLQPLRQAQQFRRRRPEAGDFSTPLIQGRSAYPVPLTAQIDARYVAANDKPSSCLLLFCEVATSSLSGIWPYLSERPRPGWRFPDSGLGESYASLTNVQSPSWNHAHKAADARM